MNSKRVGAIARVAGTVLSKPSIQKQIYNYVDKKIQGSTRRTSYRQAGYKKSRYGKKYRYKKKKRGKKKMFNSRPALQLRLQNTAGTITTPVSQQVFTSFSRVLSTSGINSIYADLGLSVSADREQLVYIESVARETWFRNQSNVQCILTLYELVPRKDVPVDDPVSYITSGLLHKTDTSIANIITPQTVYVNPTYSSDFNQMYKVNALKKVVLDPGELYCHKFFARIKRYFKSSRLNDGYQHFKGFTKILMVKTMGGPINDVAGATVGTSSNKLIFSNSEKIRYRLVEKQNTKWVLGVNIGVPGTENVMVEDTDEVQPKVNA